MADKKAQLPGEPLLDYIERIGTGEYVKRLSQEKVALLNKVVLLLTLNIPVVLLMVRLMI
jgi:hypothetical protein